MTDSDQLERVARAMSKFDKDWTDDQGRRDRGGYMRNMAAVAIAAMSPPSELDDLHAATMQAKRERMSEAFMLRIIDTTLFADTEARARNAAKQAVLLADALLSELAKPKGEG